jgi:hypothetical protein
MADGDNLTYFLEVKMELQKGQEDKLREEAAKVIENVQKSLPPLLIKAKIDPNSLASFRNQLGGGSFGSGGGVEEFLTRQHEQLAKNLAASGGAGSGKAQGWWFTSMHAKTAAGRREAQRELDASNRRNVTWALKADADWKAGIEASPEYQREQTMERIRHQYRLFQGDPAKEEEHVAKKWKELRESMLGIKEPIDWLKEGFNTIGQGAWRRGAAQIATGALGESPAAAIIGGLVGGITSSIALPIVWAIGNALMQLPQHISERIDWERYVGSIGARAGKGGDSKLSGKEWNKQAGIVENFFGSIYGDKHEWLRTKVPGMFLEYQATGMNPGNPEQAARASMVAGLLEAGGLETDSIGMMRVMKLLETGTSGQKAEAMSQLAGRGYIHGRLISDIIKRRRLSGPLAEYYAEEFLKKELSLPPGTTVANTPEHYSYLLEQAAQDERVKGELEMQRRQSRLTPEMGWSNLLFGPTAISMPANKREFVEMMSIIEKAKREGKKGILNPEEDRLFRPIISFEQAESYAKRRAITRGLSEDDIKELEKIATAKGGSFEKFLSRSDVTTRDIMPSQYQWASFSGLAEQMQMMWSGAPADAMERSANTLDNIQAILENIDDRSSGRGQYEPENAIIGGGGDF